jgi:cobalt-zinc-cadmium efflux system outer membrane protein
VRDRKATAAGHYEVTHAAQAEPLTAEVELAHVVHRGVVLTAERAVILARINGLLHRRPEEPLPPAPDRPDIAIGDLSDAAAFQTEALARRPERLRGEALVRGSDLGVERAEIDYFPDFTVSTGYSSMWREGEHQWMAGFGFDLPLALGRRRAAVDEAEARRMEARSRLEGTEDRIRVEVETARQRLMEAHHVLAVYRERLLPTAKARIDSARINYTTGLGAFEEMIAAERALRDLEIQNVEAVADLGRRRAEFERALGRTPGLGKESGQ